jgi:biofilm PGA synthesis N-glycosyltransferase PgaC
MGADHSGGVFVIYVFWLSVAVVLYVYAGYPLLLVVWSRVFGRPPRLAAGGVCPGVSIVLVARNEAGRLAARLENLLTLEYDGLRQIVVVSDGSTDDTPEVLRRFGSRVDLIVLPPLGKAAALNHGVAIARHEFLVFADARQTFATDALLEIVRPFADPSVGGVTGALLLDAECGERRMQADRRRRDRPAAFDRRQIARSAVAEGMGLYWRYEKALRRMESAVGSTLGATGAIYALRRSLWQPLPADTLLDDVLAPMRVVLAGWRVVFHEHARAGDDVSASAALESRRKVRTLAGNVQILWLEPRLLLPLVNPVWLQYVSHKVGRLVVPYAMVAIFAANLALADRRFYLALLIAQCLFYLLAAYGAILESRRTARSRLTAPLPRPSAQPPSLDRRPAS